MYVNYGDRDFFENGILVDTEHSDTAFPMLLCQPYPDEEDLYQFGMCEVDIDDEWIDRKAVMKFIGMSEETFDPVQFAIGCVGFYSWDNFGAMNYAYDWTRMDQAGICEILKHRMIASDNLDMVWLDSEDKMMNTANYVIGKLQKTFGTEFYITGQENGVLHLTGGSKGIGYVVEVTLK